MKTTLALITTVAFLTIPALVMAQSDAPFECDGAYGDCGTPYMSGGGCGCGCGSILINNTDLGDTYQYGDDYDDDGVDDQFDNCAFAHNMSQADMDGDGIGDACDICRDVVNEFQVDLDGDGLGDACDEDADGDSINDIEDSCPARANPLQVDTDGDGIGDACDEDDDNDGFFDLDDNCPLISNADQVMPAGGDCYADQDGDGIYDSRDNCPTMHNPEQLNTDDDLYGDECDTDIDDDGVLNAVDNCQLVYNPEQIDADRDGLGDGENSCDSGFCYVIYGDTENCLDPEGAFDIYTPSIAELLTGDEVRLRMFVNREGGVPVEYRWTVESAPGGSTATVRNPYGSVNYASPFELHYAEGNEATFVPDQPGEYILRLVATQVWEDQFSGQLGETDEALAFLIVEGDAINAAAGCSVAGSRASSSAFALLALLGLFVARRFRRN